MFISHVNTRDVDSKELQNLKKIVAYIVRSTFYSSGRTSALGNLVVRSKNYSSQTSGRVKVICPELTKKVSPFIDKLTRCVFIRS